MPTPPPPEPSDPYSTGVPPVPPVPAPPVPPAAPAPAAPAPPPYTQAPVYGQPPAPPYTQPAAYGQQPPAYGQQPYGQVPAYGQPPVAGPRNSNDAIIALVLSICAWLLCPIILAIVALVFASRGKREIAASGGWVTGEGMVTAAKWISWINIAFYGFLLVLFVIVIIAAAVSTPSSRYAMLLPIIGLG